ncbi:macrolide ABC transporter permease [Siphonobacter sp. BAB-5405]|uniref:FtsX-like permease family protein n=1 Tax=Siphonobacter sp. BAB-5405 TaxID=1864825 RepID=UPI000C805DE5|nr:FtsX-like permease family protein [Siphonobacter sp. BAB-5405]PMD91242.1 macrolide ABC transporter permease [Siphonobacter sp. BAB-5405]
MLRHFFTLIWNKRRAHTLLMIEIGASFLVLFGVFSLLIASFRRYWDPIGFSYENVWVLKLSQKEGAGDTREQKKALLQRIRSYPEVQRASLTNQSFPEGTQSDSINYKQQVKTSAIVYDADEELLPTLQLQLKAGRWFGAQDRVFEIPDNWAPRGAKDWASLPRPSYDYRPVIVNKKFQETLFPNEDPIGKVINRGAMAEWRIVGMVDHFRKDPLAEEVPVMFETAVGQYGAREMSMLIKTRAGVDATFQSQLMKEVSQIAKDVDAEMIFLDDIRKQEFNDVMVLITIFLLISGFLLMDVVLGLFGILHLNMISRKSEIGLRRAMGATEGAITLQFMSEIWVLTTFSIAVSLVVALQFPLLNAFDMDASVYLTAILAAIISLYVLVTLCAWYPSRLASRIQPAVALHEE